MSTEPTWQRHLWRNLGTGYLQTVVRLVSGLFLFGLTYRHLSETEFGFYTLLWSLFGFLIIFDFGLGFAAQKATAQKTEQGDEEGLSVLLSTVFWGFTAVSILIVVIAFLVEPFVLVLSKVPAEEREVFGRAYRIFFVGLAVILPATTFVNVLAGLQRLDITNLLNILGSVVTLAALPYALLHHWPLDQLMFIPVGACILSPAISYVMVRRLIPGISFHPKYFDRRALGPVVSFSAVAFLITCTEMILAKTDQAVISFTLGVAALTLYQAGFKAAEMFSLITHQVITFLVPASAQLSARGEKKALRDLLLKTSGFMLLISTPLAALTFVYLEPLIAILTGLDEVPRICLLVGRCLLVAAWWNAFASACTKSVLLMSDGERPLLRFSLLEAIANLVLSLILVFQLGILGVALGTLIPTLIVGWLRLQRLAAPLVELRVLPMLGTMLRPVAVPVLASLATLATICWLFPFSSVEIPADVESRLLYHVRDFLSLSWRGLLVVGVAAALALGHVRQFASELRGS